MQQVIPGATIGTLTRPKESLLVLNMYLLGAWQVRKLQQEHDWLQNQIEPGSVPDKAEDVTPLLQRPPIRHLSF